jgi:hypothetical protein
MKTNVIGYKYIYYIVFMTSQHQELFYFMELLKKEIAVVLGIHVFITEPLR